MSLAVCYLWLVKLQSINGQEQSTSRGKCYIQYHVDLSANFVSKKCVGEAST